MAVADAPISLDDQQHIVLDDVSWEFYEQFLKEIGDRPIRATYDQGALEIMSPLPKHDRPGQWIARLIELLCTECSIPVDSLGSTTFRSKKKRKGLEPDKCFYIQHYGPSLELEDEFDPDIHPAPDLAVEIDITSRSVPREPIYAALGVAELWRFDGKHLRVLHLVKGKYVQRAHSLALPFLPMAEFEKYVLRYRDANQLHVIRQFRDWINNLPKRR
jgi:Uma2 family endonuclease